MLSLGILTTLMVKPNNFVLIPNQDFHFVCQSASLRVQEVAERVMCLLSARSLMLKKPLDAFHVFHIPYPLPSLCSPLDSSQCVSAFYW